MSESEWGNEIIYRYLRKRIKQKSERGEMNRACRLVYMLDSASNHNIRRLLSSTSDKPVCIEADVGSAEMEGATSDVLPSYK